jgi:hypothetical protein
VVGEYVSYTSPEAFERAYYQQWRSVASLRSEVLIDIDNPSFVYVNDILS